MPRTTDQRAEIAETSIQKRRLYSFVNMLSFARMSRFTRAGAWILVAVVVLLPLYELSDYTEVWPQDGNVILPIIAALLAGMALVSKAFFKEAVNFLVRLYVTVERWLAPLPVCKFVLSILAPSPPREIDLTLAFSGLRI